MKYDKDIKTVDVMFRTAMITMSNLNMFYAKNNKALELHEFMKIQKKSFEEALKVSDKNE